MSGQTRTARHVNAFGGCLHVGINLSETPGCLQRARARDAQPCGSTLDTCSGDPLANADPNALLAALYVRIDKEIRRTSWRNRVEVVAMDGFTGFKTAASEELPDAVAVMDPFHVVRLASDALDRCRRRVQLAIHGHRGRKSDPLCTAGRTLHTGADLLTDSLVWIHVSAGEARLRGSVVQRRGLPDGLGVGTPVLGRPRRLPGHRRGMSFHHRCDTSFCRLMI